MTGADIIGGILRADEAILVKVALGSIKAGKLPDGVALPALLVRFVSGVERQPLKRGPTVRQTDRIAVTVRANSYSEQEAVIALVKAACAGRVGDIGGASAVSILTAGTGPDILGPGNSFEKTQDFRVGYDA